MAIVEVLHRSFMITAFVSANPWQTSMAVLSLGFRHWTLGEMKMDNRLKIFYDELLVQRASRPLRQSNPPVAPVRPAAHLLPVVDADRCIRCNECVEACMFDAIDPEDVPKIDEARCSVCGACIVVCPTEALTWPR